MEFEYDDDSEDAGDISQQSDNPATTLPTAVPVGLRFIFMVMSWIIIW